MTPARSYEDYAKMRVGVKTVEDAILNLNPYKNINGRLNDKKFILKSLANHDYDSLREISNLFFERFLLPVLFQNPLFSWF